MAQSTSVNGSRVKLMVKAKCITLMEIATKESGERIRRMARASTFMRITLIMKEIGHMINSMASAMNIGQMVHSIKGNFSKARSKVMVN